MALEIAVMVVMRGSAVSIILFLYLHDDVL